jgi:hypothetical protein
MASRLTLHEELCKILGSRNVYFQPPESIKLKYPAIVYSRKNIDSLHANNQVYKQSVAYDITVIDEDPDSEVVWKISQLPSCRFDRHFASEHLNHDTFTLFY